MTGASTITEAIGLRKQITKILQDYGFELRKWQANDKLILDVTEDTLNKEIRAKDNETKTLGIIWNSSLDTLKHKVNNISIAATATKRTILSCISQIFDPLGLISPTTVKGKRIIQRLWQLKLAWDESIPEDLYTKWITFYKGLIAINDISIGRKIFLKSYNELQFHGFCDASLDAYGACIYVRSRKDNSIKTSLLIAKTRVAPLKKISLPRLELCGALLLAKLLEKTRRALTCDMANIVLWCDSTIVLNWISSEPGRWQIFVANRISQIQDLTRGAQWRHVSSKENPADLASRGVNAYELIKAEIWWKGPAWLEKTYEYWPTLAKLESEEMPEQKKRQFTFVNVTKCDLFERFSSLHQLQQVTAYCLRFYNASKNKIPYIEVNLSLEELKTALYTLIRLAQKEMFSQDITCLKKGKNLPNSSNILRLTPFLDKNDILRVGGRLSNCEYSYEASHQIILPLKHKLTYLTIRNAHLRNLHIGPQGLLASFRQRF